MQVFSFPVSFSLLCFLSLSIYWLFQGRIGCQEIRRERKGERMRPKKRKMPVTEVAKFGTIRLTWGCCTTYSCGRRVLSGAWAGTRVGTSPTTSSVWRTGAAPSPSTASPASRSANLQGARGSIVKIYRPPPPGEMWICVVFFHSYVILDSKIWMLSSKVY